MPTFNGSIVLGTTVLVKTGIDLRNIGNIYFEVLNDYGGFWYVFVDIWLDRETDA